MEGRPAVLADLARSAPGRRGHSVADAEPRGPSGAVWCLGVSALLWAGLYGLAAGAAAFAGERETGTLRLLDVLPADRRVVWAGKFSFALVTTLILTFVLVVMAALSTESWNPQHPLTPSDAVGVSLCVLMALGWGFFWSSILKSALRPPWRRCAASG